MLCYGIKIGKQPFNEMENDNEHSMCENDLKDDIDAIKEKIHALTEEKAKLEYEYRYLCDVNNFEKLLKENSNKLQEFKILIGCRNKEGDNEHWSNILIDGSASNKITIQYPLSVDFDREFRELIYKYLKKSIQGLIEP